MIALAMMCLVHGPASPLCASLLSLLTAFVKLALASLTLNIDQLHVQFSTEPDE